MLITYASAAHSKFCSRAALEAGRLEGILRADNVFVSWDEVFEMWTPAEPAMRFVESLNVRRLDSKTMLVSRNSKPVVDIHRRASTMARTMGAADYLVIPVNMDNVRILFRTHDGFHDGQVYCEEAMEEFEDMVAGGERLYQVRLGLRPEHYSGRHLYPSSVITETSLAGLLSESISSEAIRQDLVDDELDWDFYRGERVIVQNKRFQTWIERIATGGDVSLLPEGSGPGLAFAEPFLPLGIASPLS